MAEWQQIAEAIANLVHAGGDVKDIGTLMKAGSAADVPLTYAAADVVEFAGSEPDHKGWQIVVLQRGWVVVGDVTHTFDEITIENASVIRKWGTTAGLGELVDGPLADTKLDAAGTVRANTLGVVLAIDVKAEKWAR